MISIAALRNSGKRTDFAPASHHASLVVNSEAIWGFFPRLRRILDFGMKRQLPTTSFQLPANQVSGWRLAGGGWWPSFFNPKSEIRNPKSEIGVACLLLLFVLGVCSCQSEPGNYLAANRSGRYVAVVSNARSPKAAKSLLRQIEAQIAQLGETRPGQKPPLLGGEVDAVPVTTTDAPEVLLPGDGAVPNWVRSGKVSVYTAENLYYDVLGGNPELYNDFGVVRQANVEYQTPRLGSRPLILVEIFDMQSPERAFGIYSRNRYPQDQFEWVGSRATVSGKTLNFCKGKYFVQVEGYEFATAVQQAIVAFGKAVADNITDAPSKPTLLSLLPQQNQIPYSEKYFPSLNTLKALHRFLPDVIASQDAEMTACSATYSHDASSKDWIDTVTVVLIHFSSASKAESQYKEYQEYLKANAEASVNAISDNSIITSGEP